MALCSAYKPFASLAMRIAAIPVMCTSRPARMRGERADSRRPDWPSRSNLPRSAIPSGPPCEESSPCSPAGRPGFSPGQGVAVSLLCPVGGLEGWVGLE